MHRTAVCKARAATTCGVSTRNRSSPVVCAGADAGTEAAAELRPPPRRPFINRISNKACDICFGAAAAAAMRARKKPAFFSLFFELPLRLADIACGARARDPGKARGDDLPHLLQNL